MNMKQIIIVEDTRNQIGKHKALNDEFNKLGVPVIRSKLYVGDYSRLDDQTVCIDTKKDWIELAGNICGKQHERFRNECMRARDADISLIVLVEEETPILEWKAPIKRNGQAISRVSPAMLSKAMSTMSDKYGVRFIHCAKSESAALILKMLRKKGEGNGDNKRQFCHF